MIETAVTVTMDDMINTSATSIPEKEMVLIKMAMDIGENVETIVTTLRHSHDPFNRIYRHVFKSNTNTMVTAEDSAADLVAHQAIIHLVGTVLPAIITRTIRKMLHSANHTKRGTALTLKTVTNNNRWVHRHKCDDIHLTK